MINVCHYATDAERRKAAQKYLQQIKNIDNQIKSLVEEAEALQDKALSIGAIQPEKDRVQTSHRSEAYFVSFIDNKIKVEKMIDAKISRLFDLKLEIRNVIEQVSDDRCKLVLRYRYINLYSWDTIQNRLNLQEKATYSIHKKALSLVADILDKQETPISV